MILVECDLRKPSVRRYLKIGRGQKGLSSILTSNVGVEECIVEADTMGFHMIHAGAIPPNPSELLKRKQMGHLIEKLKESYDFVILDAPPVTVVTDAAIVGRMADGALLVVRSKFAQTKTVRLAKHCLESVNVPLLGVVVTRFNEKRSGWRSGYQYGSYEYTNDKSIEK